MKERFKQIKKIIMVILLAFGVGMLILIQVVERKNLTELKEPITFIILVYIALVVLNVIFLHAIPPMWNYYKGKKDRKD